MRSTRSRAPRSLAVLSATLLLTISCKDTTTPESGPGPPVRLAFATQPLTTIANTLMPAVTVEVRDAAGNHVTKTQYTVTLALAGPASGASLSGSTTVSSHGGVATFDDLKITPSSVGYRLIASATGLTGAVSDAFDAIIGPPARLEFKVQPALANPGSAINPAVTVVVLDAGSNPVTSTSIAVTMAIGTNPGNGALSGTRTMNAVSGVVTFANLSIDNVGEGYTLTASSANLTSATSSGFSIRNPLRFSATTGGYFHSCGLTPTGAAHCWGANTDGQLGSSIGTTGSTVAAPVSGGLTFAQIGAGRDHTCAVSAAGGAYCWGLNNSGRLGDGSVSSSLVPRLVAGGRTYASVIAGYAHTCGVTTDGTAYCWGSNASGEIGNNTTLAASSVPVPVSGGLTFASISPGRFFTCGLTTTQQGYCWGDNSVGELGDGTIIQRSSPVAVLFGLTLAQIGAGGFHSCGLTTAGAVWCWGANDAGQLGNGSTTPSVIPVAVSGGHTFAVLSVGNRHNCGVTTGGIAYCWGENGDGRVGSGTNTNSPIPVAVAGGLTFANVTAGRFHSCGVNTSGTAYCWGANGAGALGNGTTTFSLVPVPVR